MRKFIILMTAPLLAACSAESNSVPLVFGTATTLGVSVGANAASAGTPEFTVGFKRAERRHHRIRHQTRDPGHRGRFRQRDRRPVDIRQFFQRLDDGKRGSRDVLRHRRGRAESEQRIQVQALERNSLRMHREGF